MLGVEGKHRPVLAADAGKVEEMETLLVEKQVSGGLSAAQLLAPLFSRSRTAQSDFLPPRFLRTKRDGSAARQEDAGARRAALLLGWAQPYAVVPGMTLALCPPWQAYWVCFSLS